jgi:diaminopimelate decarboxylase
MFSRCVLGLATDEEFGSAQALHSAGCFFEVASSGEIDVLQRASVPLSEVLHTNPMLKDSDIACTRL